MYISVFEATKRIGCSPTAIHMWVRQEKLIGKFELHGKRKVLRVCQWSVHQFIEENKQNKRIGRELYSRAYRRNPVISKGYRMIYKPEHPRAYLDGMVAEHIIVMEATLGRSLTKEETVHHINRIRHDNRPENLKLYSSKAQHMKEAHAQELKDKLHRA